MRSMLLLGQRNGLSPSTEAEIKDPQIESQMDFRGVPAKCR